MLKESFRSSIYAGNWRS